MYCPFRALLHLPTWSARRRTFEHVAASLRPGERFAWNAFAFDHTYKAWDDLLKKHVRYVESGNASRVSYAGFAKDHAALQAVLADFSKVPKAEFDGWAKPQQQAFLINAYNAFTIEKILTRHPDIKSIRDFGTVFGNP